MTAYIMRRLGYMLLNIWLISVVSFVIIQLPPGDFLTSYLVTLQAEMGSSFPEGEVERLREQYGLDKTPVEQYIRWIDRLLHGDMGRSFAYARPVEELIASRIPATIGISLTALLFTYLLAIPIGIYSARHQYSLGDYLATFIGFIGLAIPDFLLALVLMWFFYSSFGLSIGGLFSPEYQNAPWSIAKVFDLLQHLPVPVLVIGTAGTAGLIRVMRATLLDEIRKPYVIAARTRGLSENRLIYKYPVRLAILPLISTIGWLLPTLVSGSVIVSIVLNLPTVGALLYQSLISQDMFLAGGCLLLLTVMTVIGMFVSDLLLAWLDPRIRLED